jgi:hypothetical protein
MARVTADLSEAKGFSVLPAGTKVKARIKEATFSNSKAAGNPMYTLTWEIIEGESAGREIRFDRVVIGGVNSRGEKLQPYGLADLIQATDMPWTCPQCGDNDRVRGIKRENYKLFCENSHPLQIDFDDANLVGLVAMLELKVRKQEGTDKEFNEVDKYHRP